MMQQEGLSYTVEDVEAPSSLWSPKMRCLKSETIIGRPLRRGILGSHPSKSFAFVISGFLLCGSSSVFGLNSILAFGSIVSWTTCIQPPYNITNSPCQSKMQTTIFFFFFFFEEENIEYLKHSTGTKIMLENRRKEKEIWIELKTWHTLASSSMVNSPGFPRLKGPTCSPSIKRISPSTFQIE